MGDTNSCYIKKDLDAYNRKSLFGFFVLIALIPFFKTSGFKAISPALSMFSDGMLLLEAVAFFLIALFTFRVSPFSWAVIAYELWNYVFAISMSGNQRPSLFYISGALGIILLFDLGFRHNFALMLDAISFIFTAFVFLNFIIVLLKPGGLEASSNGTIYLFGLRTGSSLVAVPAIAFCVFRDSCEKRQYFSQRTLLCMACSALTLIMQWVATGIVELLIIFAFYFLIRRFRKFKLNIWILLLACGLLDFLIVYLRLQNIFSGFIVGFLHKDITLSGRTYIWDAVINSISRSPVFGYGAVSTVSAFNIQIACHNQWLYIAHESGYVGLILFLISVLVSFRIASRYKNTSLYTLFVIMMAGVLVATISEIQLYVPFFYALLSFPAQWKHAGNIEKATIPAFMWISWNSKEDKRISAFKGSQLK